MVIHWTAIKEHFNISKSTSYRLMRQAKSGNKASKNRLKAYEDFITKANKNKKDKDGQEK